MRLLHQLAHDRHITVVCSISEASSDDYRFFDHVLLMRDCELSYAGPAGDAPLRALAAYGVTRQPDASMVEYLRTWRAQRGRRRWAPYER